MGFEVNEKVSAINAPPGLALRRHRVRSAAVLLLCVVPRLSKRAEGAKLTLPRVRVPRVVGGRVHAMPHNHARQLLAHETNVSRGVASDALRAVPCCIHRSVPLVVMARRRRCRRANGLVVKSCHPFRPCRLAGWPHRVRFASDSSRHPPGTCCESSHPFALANLAKTCER